VKVIWHDLECGGYVEDLPLWRELAARQGDPILDVGAGTGRVTLDLARHGHEVTALDRDPVLLDELARRAAGLPVTLVSADARDFTIATRFALCLVPMQTIQLLGGESERLRFLRRARAHLRANGVLAVAIAEAVEPYEIPEGALGPLPDVLERDGVVYFSQPTAVRVQPGGFDLERRRERVGPQGDRTVEEDTIRLDAVSASQLEFEVQAAGLQPLSVLEIPATDEHVGSTVVVAHA
jgi:SAM-dependent methyltransferase